MFSTNPMLPVGAGLSTEAQRDAAPQLLRMIWGIHISRCVYVVAELGIADLLADGPLSSSELATATGTHEPSLYRVLRVLAALGVFAERDGGRFELTAIGERLRSGAPGGMRSWATFMEALGGVRPFEHILETVRTGRPGMELEHGCGVFEFLADRPEASRVFDEAMSGRTAAYAASVAQMVDFSDTRTVIDVGGGKGTLLVEILRAHAHLTGVLFETPAVAARADALLDAADLTDRCEVFAGDFFERVPAHGDCYVLANVLHDWDDTRAIEILRNCRKAMAGTGRVLIIERLIPEGHGDALPALLSDINMLVITGGQERTNAEYWSLLEAAALTPGAIHQVAFPYGVIEAVAP
jgi:hypothetical protein